MIGCAILMQMLALRERSNSCVEPRLRLGLIVCVVAMLSPEILEMVSLLMSQLELVDRRG